MPIAAPELSGLGGTKDVENAKGGKELTDAAFGDACLEGALSGDEVWAGDTRCAPLVSEPPLLTFWEQF
jgi:hypothetical protein